MPIGDAQAYHSVTAHMDSAVRPFVDATGKLVSAGYKAAEARHAKKREEQAAAKKKAAKAAPATLPPTKVMPKVSQGMSGDEIRATLRQRNIKAGVHGAISQAQQDLSAMKSQRPAATPSPAPSISAQLSGIPAKATNRAVIHQNIRAIRKSVGDSGQNPTF